MRAGVTVLEVAIAAGLAILALGVLGAGVQVLGRLGDRGSDALEQVHDAMLLVEEIRQDLVQMQLNPTAHAEEHEGNTFAILDSGGSIRFVTRVRESGRIARRLVTYTTTPREGGLKTLRRSERAFTHDEPWSEPDAADEFPDGWLGPELRERSRSYTSMNLVEIGWEHRVPREDDGQVYFRVTLLLRGRHGVKIPLTTLVAVPSPRDGADVSACPCVNAPCFDPAHPDCNCCQSEAGAE